MPGAEQLQEPVGYDERWLLAAGLALAVVACYYAAVLWWGRRRRPRPRAPRPGRADCLAELARIEADVAQGRLSAREGHQRISATVRGFVADTAGIPARTMTLADLERAGPPQLAAVVALVYPPEFGPGEELPRRSFGTALSRARELVSSWS